MRIAIVNDTSMSVLALQSVIELNGEHTVAWVAIDGNEAVKACAKDTPDLILMDIVMPIMDGVEATKQIMQQSPCAILIVTSTITGNASKVFEAMGAGALDVISTPVLTPVDGSEVGYALLHKINMIRKLISFEIKKQEPFHSDREKQKIIGTTSLIAIGSSTGGPTALTAVLKNLPINLPAAFVIVQHVDKQFIDNFVSWLDSQIELPVRLAHDGDKIEVGTVLVANPDQHLILTKQQTLSYTTEPEDYPYKPSVNVFFNSIATNRLENAIGILLTGMGKDGASGLLAMQQKGFSTIAQEETSCVVYGMPKAAVELNAADLVLSPVEINEKIIRKFSVMNESLNYKF